MKECYFGEWVEYSDEEDRKEAKKYLDLWKKFALRKLMKEGNYHGETWIDRPNENYPNTLPTLGIKIEMGMPDDYQADQFGPTELS